MLDVWGSLTRCTHLRYLQSWVHPVPCIAQTLLTWPGKGSMSVCAWATSGRQELLVPRNTAFTFCIVSSACSCAAPMRCPAQTFKKIIGEGSIGRVHLGRWQETDVAIKVLTSLSNIAVGMASASPTPRTGAASAKTDRGDAYGGDALATKRTLEREARPLLLWRPVFPGSCMESVACKGAQVNISNSRGMVIVDILPGL